MINISYDEDVCALFAVICLCVWRIHGRDYNFCFLNIGTMNPYDYFI